MNQYQKDLAKRNAISKMRERERIRVRFHNALTEYLTLLEFEPGKYDFIVQVEALPTGTVNFNVPYMLSKGEPK